MIWLLTAVVVVALIVLWLRIGAWYLLKYDTKARAFRSRQPRPG